MFKLCIKKATQIVDEMKLEGDNFNSILLQHIEEKVFVSNIIPSYNFDYWSMNETDRYTIT